jgi:hypothetical protein
MSSVSELETPYLKQLAVLVELLKKDPKTEIYANQVQFFYDDFYQFLESRKDQRLILPQGPSVSLVRVGEGLLKLQAFV